MSDDLSALKDDMNAFIVGHGLARFQAYVSEEVQSVLWETGDNPDSWKDFVELAKASGITFLTVSDELLQREDVDFLVDRLSHSSAVDDEEVEEARWLRSHIGKVGFLQLGFSYHGTMFLYEVSTPWYERYQQLLEAAETIDGIMLDERDDDDR
jgi:hypothetical protein